MLLRCAVICAALAMSTGVAHAQAWPSHPIRLIVPNGPGLASDILARLFADRMSQALGQQMYVENIPGASGITGAVAASRAASDGYRFFFANASGLTSNMVLFKALPYDPTKDFTPVALLTDSGPFVVAVNPDLPVKTLPQLIAYGKANPGKLAYGVDATSGYGVVIGKLLNKRGDLGMVEVPYRSTPQLLADTAERRIPLLISSLPASDAFAKSGKLRRIAGDVGKASLGPGRHTDDRRDAAGFHLRRLVCRRRAGRYAGGHRSAGQRGDGGVPQGCHRQPTPCRLHHGTGTPARRGRDRCFYSRRAGKMAQARAGNRSAAAVGLSRDFTSAASQLPRSG